MKPIACFYLSRSTDILLDISILNAGAYSTHTRLILVT